MAFPGLRGAPPYSYLQAKAPSVCPQGQCPYPIKMPSSSHPGLSPARHYGESTAVESCLLTSLHQSNFVFSPVAKMSANRGPPNLDSIAVSVILCATIPGAIATLTVILRLIIRSRMLNFLGKDDLCIVIALVRPRISGLHMAQALSRR